LGIVQGGGSQYDGDWNLSIGHIPMQFVASPVVSIPLAVFLCQCRSKIPQNRRLKIPQ
jgi:hypothetical protein